MSTDFRADELERRIQNLYASDPQFAKAGPDAAVSAAMERPGLRLSQLVQTVIDGYANRPALGQVAYRTGRYATFLATMHAALSGAGDPVLAP